MMTWTLVWFTASALLGVVWSVAGLLGAFGDIPPSPRRSGKGGAS